ncbi:hypothetical protein E3N88_32262 [Mikania micrantha]|uniref:Uncharacterized protein n=1 Tax=Mikania micrantha TaxID=192012 RepID=A0A5N6M8P2_9ASTR|nr:hypothetical protein E3N88_32262 [Mikania micrantha]
MCKENPDEHDKWLLNHLAGYVVGHDYPPTQVVTFPHRTIPCWLSILVRQLHNIQVIYGSKRYEASARSGNREENVAFGTTLTKYEASIGSSEDDEPSVERSRGLTKSAMPKRSVSIMKRIPVRQFGSRTTASINISSNKYKKKPSLKTNKNYAPSTPLLHFLYLRFRFEKISRRILNMAAQKNIRLLECKVFEMKFLACLRPSKNFPYKLMLCKVALSVGMYVAACYFESGLSVFLGLYTWAGSGYAAKEGVQAPAGF